MKNLLYILIFFILGACSLDLPIEDKITGEDAIDNVNVANEALADVYLELPKNKLTFSILADEFYPNKYIARNADAYNLYKWGVQQIKTFSDYRWGTYYSTLSKTNMLLRRIPYIQTKNKKEEDNLKYIKAQALALKAYCFFNLIEIYTAPYDNAHKNDLGIILKETPDYEQKPRATLEESYQRTEEIILEALSLFEDSDNNKYRWTKKSTQALLAKLYLDWHQYEKCINLCNQLVNNGSINEENYTLLWNNPEKSTETLLAAENLNSDYFSDLLNISNENMFYANRNIEFKDTDYRKAVTFIPKEYITLNNEHFTANYIKKYRNNLDDKVVKPYVLIRLAEIYFIKAEAEYHLGNVAEAQKTINSFLVLRGAEPIETTGEAFFTDLLKQKRKEFLGEGIYYFDLKRNHLGVKRVSFGSNKEVQGISSDDFKWIFPIPYNEIKQNKNAKQNPKWENYIY